MVTFDEIFLQPTFPSFFDSKMLEEIDKIIKELSLPNQTEDETIDNYIRRVAQIIFEKIPISIDEKRIDRGNMENLIKGYNLFKKSTESINSAQINIDCKLPTIVLHRFISSLNIKGVQIQIGLRDMYNHHPVLFFSRPDVLGFLKISFMPANVVVTYCDKTFDEIGKTAAFLPSQDIINAYAILDYQFYLRELIRRVDKNDFENSFNELLKKFKEQYTGSADKLIDAWSDAIANINRLPHDIEKLRLASAYIKS